MNKIDGYELLPCPFCGSDKLSIYRPYKYMDSYHVECMDCGAEGSISPIENEAVNLWNTRVTA